MLRRHRVLSRFVHRRRVATRCRPARSSTRPTGWGASAALVVLLVGLSVALPGYADVAKTFEITISDGRVSGEKSVRVTQGDTVILRWSSDARLELHLHGYDIETTVTPGAPAEMKIEARATGRFPVEIHGQDGGGHGHGALFYLEVYPR